MANYIHYTQEQKDRARTTDIVDLLERQGERLKRSGKEYQWRDGSEKVTIRGNLWYHQYEEVGGDAIDFVRKFYNKNYPEAMEYLLNGYGGAQYGQYEQYGWNPWTSWGDFTGWSNAQQNRQTERSEYTAAKNYIRNGMYREALNALSGVPMSERDGKWYYLSAGANMYMGNKVTALEHAKRAVEIEPGNEEYRRLLEQLQSGRDFYDSYSTGYGHRVNLSPLWLALCGSQLLCGQTCGCPMIYCF